MSELPEEGVEVTFESIPGVWRWRAGSAVVSARGAVRCVGLEPVDDEARAFIANREAAAPTP